SLVRLRPHQRGVPVVTTRLVVKVGGAVAAESADRILGLVEDGHEVVVVHGAGPQITEEMQRRGITVEFVGGRRRTSRAALDVVPGLYVEGDLVDRIGAGRATRMLAEGAFEGGIVPKLRAAALAAGSGITAEIGLTAVVA